MGRRAAPQTVATPAPAVKRLEARSAEPRVQQGVIANRLTDRRRSAWPGSGHARTPPPGAPHGHQHRRQADQPPARLPQEPGQPNRPDVHLPPDQPPGQRRDQPPQARPAEQPHRALRRAQADRRSDRHRPTGRRPGTRGRDLRARQLRHLDAQPRAGAPAHARTPAPLPRAGAARPSSVSGPSSPATPSAKANGSSTASGSTGSSASSTAPPAEGGRAYLVERELETKDELDALIADYLQQATKLDSPPLAVCPLENNPEANA